MKYLSQKLLILVLGLGLTFSVGTMIADDLDVIDDGINHVDEGQGMNNGSDQHNRGGDAGTTPQPTPYPTAVPTVSGKPCPFCDIQF